MWLETCMCLKLSDLIDCLLCKTHNNYVTGPIQSRWTTLVPWRRQCTNLHFQTATPGHSQPTGHQVHKASVLFCHSRDSYTVCTHYASLSFPSMFFFIDYYFTLFSDWANTLRVHRWKTVQHSGMRNSRGFATKQSYSTRQTQNGSCQNNTVPLSSGFGNIRKCHDYCHSQTYSKNFSNVRFFHHSGCGWLAVIVQ